MENDLVSQIDAVLPQTQCTRCGYPSCLEYANAISIGKANINQCPPGGDTGIEKLALLLNVEVLPLNPENGEIKHRQIAVIDEEACIGCTLCIKACPVDAILGSNKLMHTVIEAECTGCDLCIPVCPVDCITMLDAADDLWLHESKVLAKSRFEWHNNRRERDRLAREKRLQNHSVKKDSSEPQLKIDLLSDILAKVK
jgi:Na+-translocating ferredoxin:NAD+ oxidoreductase subunit B